MNIPHGLTYNEYKQIRFGDEDWESLEHFRKKKEGKRLGIGYDDRPHWEREIEDEI